MKIIKIEEKQPYYKVSLIPNWFEKIFGIKEKTLTFKDSYSVYSFGGGSVYIQSDGEKLPYNHYIGKAIDKHRRSFKS